MAKPALPLFITPLALHDLEQIWLYTAEKWSMDQADAYTREIADVFDLICRNPKMAHAQPNLTSPVRIHAHKSHLIIYLPTARLEIIRILHSRQQWQDILK